MKQVLVFLIDDFEEVEAIAPIDLLRRAGCNVVTAAVGTKDRIVNGAHGIPIVADVMEKDIPEQDFDCVFVPGGSGSLNLPKSAFVKQQLLKARKNNAVIAAICAAPAVVLGPFGLLEGHKAVCFPGMEKSFPSFAFGSDKVVSDGELITARGAGVAVEFALAIIAKLFGEKAAEEMAERIVK